MEFVQFLKISSRISCVVSVALLWGVNGFVLSSIQLTIDLAQGLNIQLNQASNISSYILLISVNKQSSSKMGTD